MTFQNDPNRRRDGTRFGYARNPEFSFLTLCTFLTGRTKLLFLRALRLSGVHGG
jgi:hypothetical protein